MEANVADIAQDYEPHWQPARRNESAWAPSAGSWWRMNSAFSRRAGRPAAYAGLLEQNRHTARACELTGESAAGRPAQATDSASSHLPQCAGRFRLSPRPMKALVKSLLYRFLDGYLQSRSINSASSLGPKASARPELSDSPAGDGA